MGIDHIVLICKIIHVQEMPDHKRKIQNCFLYLFLMFLFQKVFHLSQKIQQLEGQSPDVLQHLPGITLSFILQHQLIAPVQDPVKLGTVTFYRSGGFQDFFLAQSGAVHLSSPVHQTMGLVNEKNIISFHSVPEKSFQMYLRIKHIVIITDYCVHPVGSIQTHFIRTYLVFLRLSQEIFPEISVSFGK